MTVLGTAIRRAAAARRACRAQRATSPTSITRRDSRLASSATTMTENLILKRAAASRSSGEWNDDDYDVFADGIVVGRIMKAAAAPVGSPWLWTLAYGQHEDRTPTHSYEATREAAMGAFAKSWRRE
jgi:hypothetical protein